MPVFTFAYASFEEFARFAVARESVTISGATVTFHSATVWMVPFAGRELIVVTCLFARNQPHTMIDIHTINAERACVFIRKKE